LIEIELVKNEIAKHESMVKRKISNKLIHALSLWFEGFLSGLKV